jgi:hypothetical protein
MSMTSVVPDVRLRHKYGNLHISRACGKSRPSRKTAPFLKTGRVDSRDEMQTVVPLPQSVNEDRKP